MKKPGLIPDRGEIERLITAVESFNQLSEVRGELSRLMNDRRVALREKIQLSLPDMAKDLNWNFEDAVSKYRQRVGKHREVEQSLAILAGLEKEYYEAAKKAAAARPDKGRVQEVCIQVKNAALAEYESLVEAIQRILMPYCDQNADQAREFATMTPAATQIYQTAAACDPILDGGSFSTRPLRACLAVFDQMAPRRGGFLSERTPPVETGCAGTRKLPL